MTSEPAPDFALTPHPVRGRIRLAARTARFALRAARAGYWDFVRNAAAAIWINAVRSVGDVLSAGSAVRCNMCGWTGKAFYPNTGPGFYEPEAICPGCLASDRYRALYEVIKNRTTALEAGSRVVEVAPLPSLESIFQSTPGVDYTSFDIERHAMERGDLTSMRFENDSVDWFICFHVLEHIPDEAAALREIRRVLRPGGSAVLQVPIGPGAKTVEYGAPDPRDVNHVRKHGADFPDRIADFGFRVEGVEPLLVADDDTRTKAALCPETIFLATCQGVGASAA